jgi:hypothetical protein
MVTCSILVTYQACVPTYTPTSIPTSTLAPSSTLCPCSLPITLYNIIYIWDYGAIRSQIYQFIYYDYLLLFLFDIIIISKIYHWCVP